MTTPTPQTDPPSPISGIYHLHAPGGQFTPALTLAQGFPKEVSGQPAAYFWKDLIRVGEYVHPTKKFRLSVDRDRLRHWADTGKRMIAAGVKIPAVVDHSDSAYDALGRVIDFKVDGDTLYALHQFIGKDAALLAARNDVSAGIDPDYVDGQGRRWGDAIIHSSLTPVPVVGGQGGFVQAASRGGLAGEVLMLAVNAEVSLSSISRRSTMGMIDCTAEHLSRGRQYLPDGDTVTEENLLERLLQHIASCNVMDDKDAGNESEVAKMSRAQRIESARNRRRAAIVAAQQAEATAAELAQTREQLAARDQQIQELSSRQPHPLDAEAQEAMIENLSTKKQIVVARGALTPMVAERLYSCLVKDSGGKINTVALSRAASGGQRALALEVFDIITDNRPVAAGEMTGVQTMSRSVPGADPDEDGRKKISDLMLSAANGRAQKTR